MLNDEVSRKYIQSLKRYVVYMPLRLPPSNLRNQDIDVRPNQISPGGCNSAHGIATIPFLMDCAAIMLSSLLLAVLFLFYGFQWNVV